MLKGRIAFLVVFIGIAVISSFPLSALSDQTEPQTATSNDAALTPTINSVNIPDTVSPIKEDPFTTQVITLAEKSFKKKEHAVNALAKIDDPRVIRILTALLEKRLFYRKEDKKVVYGDKISGGYEITDAETDESLGIIEKRKLKKISSNNKIRRQIKRIQANFMLSSTQSSVRLNASRKMLEEISSDTADVFREALINETDQDVIDVFNTGIALSELTSSDKSVRIKAITYLSTSLYSQASNSLETLLEKDEQGNYIEKDIDIRNAATSSLKRIRGMIDRYEFLQTLFFGVGAGAVLLLAAIGLAITFGVMGVINMAHGELIMLGAYTTYVVQQIMPDHIGMSIFVAIPAAFIVSGLVGIAIERGVIRHLYGRPLDTLLATFGISLILQQLVRSVFTALNKPVKTPDWMSGSLEINPAFSITYNWLYIIIFSFLVFLVLMIILKKTSLGLHVRAVSQNRNMAKAMGVKTERVDALTFGLGSGIAGVAGVAISQITNVGPNLGQSYIIDSFMVVVFGGVGNLWGTLVGGMSFGIVKNFLEPEVGAVLAKILLLIFIILFIQKRPRGLFPQKGRAAEN